MQILVWKQMNYANMNEKEKSQIVAEVNILRDFKHPFIVRYYDRIIDKVKINDTCIYLNLFVKFLFPDK